MTIKTSITRIAIIAALACGSAAALTPSAEARGFGHRGFGHGGFHGGHGWGGHRWGGHRWGGYRWGGFGYGYGYRPYYSYSGYGGC